MAKKLEGITIEIDGETSKLRDSLKSVNSQLYSVDSELRQVKNSLKFDSSNVDLLKQKQMLLTDAISQTKEKLSQLKTAQEQMKAQGIDETSASYRELTREISSCESKLKSYVNEQDAMNDSAKKIDFSKIKDGLSSVGTACADVAKKVAAVSTAITVAFSALVAKSISAAGELEQQIGGTEAVFGEYAKTIQESANNAASSAGLSANTYMEYANKIGSLMKGSGIDVSEATDLATQAMQRAADVASIMGISTESAMEAITGAAKGNFTMMDNLGVAMNATSLSAYAVEKGITKSYSSMSQAEKVGLAYQMFLEKTADYAGNYAKENQTFAGSLSTVKAALTNLMAGTGNLDDVSESVLNFVTILGEKIMESAPTLLESLSQLISIVIPQVGQMLITSLPILLEKIGTILVNIVSSVKDGIPQLTSVISSLIKTIVEFLASNLPQIIATVIQLIASLASSMGEELPVLIPVIIQGLLDMISALLDNIDLIIDAGIQLIVGLTEGIINALPDLIDRIPEIIDKLVEAIVNNLPKLLEAGFKLIAELAVGLVKAIPNLVKAIPQIITSLLTGIDSLVNKVIDKGKEVVGWVKNGIVSGLSSIVDAGKQLMSGLVDGLKSKWESLKTSVSNLGSSIVSKFKSVFGIHSPSKVMKDQVGKFLGLGLVEGIESTKKDVDNAVSDLSSGIQASVNPVINPSGYYKNQIQSSDINSSSTSNNREDLVSAFKEALNGMAVNLNDDKVGELVVEQVEKVIYS